MTKDAGSFSTALVNDLDFAGRLNTALDGLDGDAAINAVSGFAARNGYAVSPGEAAGMRAAVLSRLKADIELPDSDMETVSGGAIWDGWDDGYQKGSDIAKSLLDNDPVSTKGDKDVFGAIGGAVGGVVGVYAAFFSKW